MDENGPKCMKERVLEHRDRSLVAPKDDDRSNNAAQLGYAPPLPWWRRCRRPYGISESAAKLPCATEPVIFINNQQQQLQERRKILKHWWRHSLTFT